MHHVRQRAGIRNPSAFDVWEALEWVKANQEKVWALAARRKARQPEILRRRESRREMKAETWKKDNPDLWKAVLGLGPCDLRDRALKVIENGKVSEGLQAILCRLVARRDAPEKGTDIDITIRIVGTVRSTGNNGQPLLRIEFLATEGDWKGRVETKDPDLWNKALLRFSDLARLEGTVIWQGGRYAIFQDPVTLTFLRDEPQGPVTDLFGG